MSRPWSDSARSAAHWLTALMIVAAVVLTATAVAKASPEDAGRVEAGSATPLDTAPYGRTGTVLLPFARLDLQVGEPTTSLGHDLAGYDYEDPRSKGEAPILAPDDGALVPVSWSALATADLGVEGDAEPIVVDLVAGAERVEVSEFTLGGSNARSAALDPTPVAIAFSAAADLGDLRVEVTYDGETQSLDPASGEVDAGLAQPLYEPDLGYDLGCGEVVDDCDLAASDPDSPLRPYQAGFSAGGLSFYPYSVDEGWAEEGTLWASTYLQTFGIDYLRSAEGRTYSCRSVTRLRVTLGGREAVRNDLEASRSGAVDLGESGFVVFSVDLEDAEDAAAVGPVVLSATADLGPGAPLDEVPVRAELPLEPR